MTGTPGQLALLDQLAGGNDHSRRLILFILTQVLSDPRALSEPRLLYRYVPVPTALVRKSFRRADLKKMKGNLDDHFNDRTPFRMMTAEERARLHEGILDYTSYDVEGGRCRHYRLKPWITDTFVKRGRSTVEEARSQPVVDLATGRPTKRVAKSRINDEHNNAFPHLIRGALRVLERGCFHAGAVEAHLDRLRRGGGGEGGRGRYLNDLRCFGMVLLQRPTEGEDGVWWYRLAYDVAYTGRLAQVGGGLQSASREMKEAAYTPIEGTEELRLVEQPAPRHAPARGRVGGGHAPAPRLPRGPGREGESGAVGGGE